MRKVNKIYSNGEFITPHGTEVFTLINPATNNVIGELTLADETDTRVAIAAAKDAFRLFSLTTVQQRIQYLEKLRDAVQNRE